MLVIAAPWALARFFGWPLPHQLPDWTTDRLNPDAADRPPRHPQLLRLPGLDRLGLRCRLPAHRHHRHRPAASASEPTDSDRSARSPRELVSSATLLIALTRPPTPTAVPPRPAADRPSRRADPAEQPSPADRLDRSAGPHPEQPARSPPTRGAHAARLRGAARRLPVDDRRNPPRVRVPLDRDLRPQPRPHHRPRPHRHRLDPHSPRPTPPTSPHPPPRPPSRHQLVRSRRQSHPPRPRPPAPPRPRASSAVPAATSSTSSTHANRTPTTATESTSRTTSGPIDRARGAAPGQATAPISRGSSAPPRWRRDSSSPCCEADAATPPLGEPPRRPARQATWNEPSWPRPTYR